VVRFLRHILDSFPRHAFWQNVPVASGHPIRTKALVLRNHDYLLVFCTKDCVPTAERWSSCSNLWNSALNWRSANNPSSAVSSSSAGVVLTLQQPRRLLEKTFCRVQSTGTILSVRSCSLSMCAVTSRGRSWQNLQAGQPFPWCTWMPITGLCNTGADSFQAVHSSKVLTSLSASHSSSHWVRSSVIFSS
jgi:hypothetical protein